MVVVSVVVLAAVSALRRKGRVENVGYTLGFTPSLQLCMGLWPVLEPLSFAHDFTAREHCSESIATRVTFVVWRAKKTLWSFCMLRQACTVIVSIVEHRSAHDA
eukprot:1161737-Pelagomonas_calceolata.AAC.6